MPPLAHTLSRARSLALALVSRDCFSPHTYPESVSLHPRCRLRLPALPQSAAAADQAQDRKYAGGVFAGADDAVVLMGVGKEV